MAKVQYLATGRRRSQSQESDSFPVMAKLLSTRENLKTIFLWKQPELQ